MKWIRLQFFSLTAVFALVACSLAPGTAPLNGETAQETQSISNQPARFRRVKCPYGNLPVEVDCGQLSTPADHFNPGSGRIRIPVTILHGGGEQTAKDPVVTLVSSLEDLQDLMPWLDQPLLKSHDLILVGLRGLGGSQPNLACPEMDNSSHRNDREAARRCYNRLISRGIDPALFTSRQAAADLVALRQALNLPEWNLLGIGHGARPVLTALRAEPRVVRSLTLDSISPLETNEFETQAIYGAQTVRALFDNCARDPGCAYAYPDLSEILDDLLISLDSSPREVTAADPNGGQEVKIYLDGAALAALIVDALDHPDTIARIPYALYEIQYGNLGAAAALMFPSDRPDLSNEPTRLGHRTPGGLAVFYSMTCNEEAPFNDLKRAEAAVQADGSVLARFLQKDVRGLFEMCEVWESGQAGPTETEPITSSTPTLILSGEFDRRALGNESRALAQDLSNSVTFVFQGAGHAFTGPSGCADQTLAAFVEDPNRKPDSSCRADLGIHFWLP